MSRKLALKKLKASDLSFFQAYLRRFPSDKQKSFNLDRRIIEDALFPSLTDVIADMPGQRALVALTLFGPGGALPHVLARKILKQEKNWRLNGEVIHNPDDEPNRYDVLAPDDLALMEFSGAGAPNSVKVVLLAAAHVEDASTHAAFSSSFPGGSMTLLTEDEIEQAIRHGAPPADHPIRDWLDKDVIEDVGRGGGEAIERLIAKRRGRGISPAELKKAKASAEEVGRLGEELLDHHFASSHDVEIRAFEWIAAVNAIAPYDFVLNHADGTARHLDAKSTAGPFANPIHVSIGEVHHATRSDVPYDIYRLYNVKESGAVFRIARNIAGRLAPIIQALKSMPAGVKVDSLSFDPNYFDFDPQETIIEYDDKAE